MGISKYLETVPRGSSQMLRNSLGPIYAVASVQRPLKGKARSISHSACKTLDLNHIFKLRTTLHTVNIPHNASE